MKSQHTKQNTFSKSMLLNLAPRVIYNFGLKKIVRLSNYQHRVVILITLPVILLLFNSCSSNQNNREKIEDFRIHKNCIVVQNFLTKFDKDYASKFSQGKIFDYSNSQGLIGELSGIFITDQPCTRKILSVSNRLSGYTKVAILNALILAESHETAKEFALKHSLSLHLESFQDTKSIKIAISDFKPTTNDLLIGAYSSTGDNLYIDNILQNFKTADKKMVKDAIRFGFMYSKFGKPSSPEKDHFVNIAKSLKKKYYNEKDPKPFLRLITLSSAFWALKSLAQNDKNLAKHLKQFFLESELKDIFLIEQNHFSNYLTSLVMDAVDIGKSDKKPFTKEEVNRQEFVKREKKLIADYENLKEPNVMELVK
jgi:hypothetical protein